MDEWEFKFRVLMKGVQRVLRELNDQGGEDIAEEVVRLIREVAQEWGRKRREHEMRRNGHG